MLRTKIKNAVALKANSFCKRSTLHGFLYFYNRRNPWIFMIWSTIISCSVALCASLSHMIWQKFVVDPTFIVVETTHFSMSEIPFPAVTICSQEVVYGPQTKNITNILRLRGYEMEQIEEFYRSFKAIESNNYQPEEFVYEIHSTLEKLGIGYDDLLDKLKTPCDMLVKRCDWKTQIIDCTKMFYAARYYTGYCCRFQMDYFKLQVDDKINFESGIGLQEAILFEVNDKKVFPNETKEDGFVSIYITPENQKLTLSDNPTWVSGDSHFDINVLVWVMDSSPDVKALSIHDRKCVFNSLAKSQPKYPDRVLNAYFGFNQNIVYKDTKEISANKHGCLIIRVIQETVAICKCLPFNYTSDILNMNYSRCSWERMICIYQNFDKIRVEKWNQIRDECYESCNKVKYNAVVEHVKSQGKKWRKNTGCTVSVHFSDNTCIKYRREVLYTWDQMLANLGGIFGLCLGGSIISIIEIIWFISDVIYTVFTKVKKNKITAQRKQPVFVVGRDMKLRSTKKDLKVKFLQ